MPGVHDPDRSERPRLPRKAKLPKTPTRPSHGRVTRATAPVFPAPVAFVASTYSTSAAPPSQLTQLDNVASPQQLSASPKRKAVYSHDPRPGKQSRRSLRSKADKLSYAEPDSDTDFSDTLSDTDEVDYHANGHANDIDNVDDESPDELSLRSQSSHPRKQLKTHALASPIKATPVKATPAKARKIEKPSIKKDLSYPGNVLPYHVWCRIFDYVACPLFHFDPLLPKDEDVSRAMRKLLQVGFLGKLVYEPAMVALYQCPPIFDSDAFQLISRTLAQPPGDTLINYRPKVEILRIDVSDILTHKHRGFFLHLNDIVPNLPRLKDLELYHDDDKPPFRSLETTVRYRYPKAKEDSKDKDAKNKDSKDKDLLKVLGPAEDAIADQGGKSRHTELRSWRWNARLAGNVYPLDDLKKIHSTMSFASLRKIAFVNYQYPSFERTLISPQLEEKDQKANTDLIDAIRALPDLEHLILESSTMADAKLLNFLPSTLKCLELINCWEVTSEDLTSFLLARGSSLERLTLKHCSALSLGFTKVLEEACPKLTHLHVNLQYYRMHEHYNDAEPLWDYLLDQDEVPTWPASIQSIEIEYMTFTSVEMGETFFSSLLASAPKLSDLRRLVLRAKMDVGWAERNEFRKFWTAKIISVFKRTDDSPVSIHHRADRRNQTRNSNRRGRHVKAPKSPVRRSTRLSDTPLLPSVDDDTVAQENITISAALSKQLQWSLRYLPYPKHDDADDEESDELAADPEGQTQRSSSRAKPQNENKGAVGFIQGLCDVVEIVIDNQKPPEFPYGMRHFVDSPSADETDMDWNGE
ncbi:hypothetical protein SLS62_006097 [Diatrype stigma]|uniref:Uncharacterized protein n=1 Tax=Diatrype stigma TaxID=117547 RepID=A0AAN9YRY7_9PEZI